MMDYARDGKFDRTTAKIRNAEDDSKELPCQVTRKVLAILGALPISLSPPYLPSLNITKSSLVYCVIVYSILSYDVIWSAIKEKRLYDEKGTTDTLRNIHLEHILAMSPHFLGLEFWIDVPALLLTLERFKDLQVKFRAATGISLMNRRKTWEKYSMILTETVLLIVLVVMRLFSPSRFHTDWVTSLTFCYGNTLALCALSVWLGLSWGVYDAAEDAKAEFRRQLNFMTPSKVYEFRLLWLSMRNTLDSMGKLQCPSALYSTSLIASVFLLYQASVLIQMGEIVFALGHLILASFYVGLVALVCTASHYVQQEMKCLVGEVLPKISLTSYDMKIQREIVMLFLIESARPAVTNFKGFTMVNKNLILSFFSNISTYLIVLVQFSQKGNGFGM